VAANSKLRRPARAAVKRLPKRASYDPAVIHAILDEGLVCHVGFQADGQVYVIPMSYARVGDRLLLHGSRKSRLMRALGAGKDVCVTVTLLDGLVLARSVFHHSMNYRSVCVFGRARRVTGNKARSDGLEALVEHLVPGRTRDARAPNPKELAATELVEVVLEETSAKIRTGPPVDDEADLDLPVWAGVLPASVVWGPPAAAPAGAGAPVPRYVGEYRRSASEG
jgi:nitroimidazol reductase NimA-like FMN-containing flavoprotein (pyridoxamine 5'-phosphate oxidase superfamily)